MSGDTATGYRALLVAVGRGEGRGMAAVRDGAL